MGKKSDVLKNLERKFRNFFEREDTAREESLKLTREIGRLSSKAIMKIHQGKLNQAEKDIQKGIEILKKVKQILKNYPEVYYAGFLHSSEKEIIEAIITLYLIRDGTIPSPEKFNFDIKSFLHGLCESTGEIRRFILDKIREGEIKKIEDYLDLMDEIYYFIAEFQYTDALTRGLRRQVDYMRSIIEKTRADVTSALITFRK